MGSAVAPVTGAVASVAGAAIQGKGAKKAAKIQQQTADKQMAQAQQFYTAAEGRYQGDIAQGDRARDLYAGMLGDGGDAAASKAAYDTWKNSVSYKSNLDTALKSVNANAYAQGMGRSGAAWKALQDRGAMVADGFQQNYMNNVNTQVQTGANAKAALTGAGQQQLTSNNASLGNAGNAASNAAISTAAGWSNAIQNIGNLAGNAYKSSYGGK